MQLPEGMNLHGKVAVVTGAGGGLGRVFARSLANAGALVAVTGRSTIHLEETVRAIQNVCGRAIAIAFDVTEEEAVKHGIRQAEEALGPIDLLVNNASDSGPIGSVWNVDSEQWWRAFETNVRGPFLCSRAVLPGMVARHSGTIINITSHAGVYRWPLCSAYAVSKGALVKFSENLAVETEPHGVSIFAFHPGLLEIGMTQSLLASETQLDADADQVASWFRRQIANGRCVLPERAAATMVALASGRYPSLSGCYLTVDDDLDELVARMNKIDVSELYRLRVARTFVDQKAD